jgi:WbqC-like protein family
LPSMFPLFPSLPLTLGLLSSNPIPQIHGSIYRKHADLNRYTILTAPGLLKLTAALASPTWQVPYGQIRLSYSESWPSKHIKSLSSAYKASPYYDHFQAEVEAILTTRYDFLYQLSAAALSFCLKSIGSLHSIEIIGIEAPLSVENPTFTPILTAARHPETPFAPPPGYRSVFGAEFDTRVSILDTLFCLGPHRLQAYCRTYTEAAS